MAVVSLVSAKGSPGVTTTAAALATAAICAGERAWWVELDPSGGSGWIRARTACPDSEPTLADVARELRHGPDAGEWPNLAVETPGGVPAVLAPTSEVAASTVISEGPNHWGQHLRASGTVLLDCGRWARTQPTASRVVGSDLAVVVCKSTLESVEHVRHWAGGLRQAARCPVCVLVVGKTPYSGDQVADAVGLPLAGSIEWRRTDVGALWARGASKQVLRSWLGRSASRALASVLEIVDTRARTSSSSLAGLVSGDHDKQPTGNLERS